VFVHINVHYPTPRHYFNNNRISLFR